MSRAPSDDLHALISALTQAERRYVKMEIRKHILGGSSQTEMLFNALAEQKTYDEQAIKRRFKGQGFVQRLPEAKRELVLVILRAMRQFHAQRTPLRRALSAYADGIFLRTRGLTRLAQRMMQDGFDNSELTANHALRSLAAEGVASVARTADVYPEPTASIEEDPTVIEAHVNLEVARMEALSDRMQNLVYRYGQTKSVVAQAIARDLVKAGADLLPLNSLASRNHWLRLQSLNAFFFESDYPRSLELDRERLAVLESNESYRSANLPSWLNLNHSLALRYALVGNLQAAIPLRDTLRQYWMKEARTYSPSNRRNVSGQYLNIELFLALNQMDIDGIADVMPTLKKILAEHESESYSEIGIAAHFNIAALEFGAARYREAVRQLNRIDDYPESMRADVKRSSIYLRILCHLEMEHDSVVTSLVRKQRRSLKGAEVSQGEELFLSTSTAYLNSAPGKKREKLLRHAVEKFDELTEAGQNTSALTMFAWREWLSAKIERRKWADLVRAASQK